MEMLAFIKTDIGVAAVRRHVYTKSYNFTQVWFRAADGSWKPYHYFSREKYNVISSDLLEALYQGMPQGEIPYEEGW